jgi:hypothetical protein
MKNEALPSQALRVIAVLLGCILVSTAATLWLWRTEALLAGFIGFMLLFGAALMLPECTVTRHAASIGSVIGYAIGSAIFLLP